MPPFDPSSQLVSVRLRALVRRDGLQGVADFYGVQRQTARRWVRGSSPNADARRSIVRRGLPLTGCSKPEWRIFSRANPLPTRGYCLSTD